MKFNSHQVRSFNIDSVEGTPNDTFIPISLSSETPCLRSFGNEILLHDVQNIDMTRTLPNGLPLLVNHNDQALPVGRLKNVRLDPETRKLRGDAYFSGREEAQAVRQDILDGVLCDVSVGYKIMDYKLERATAKDEPSNFFVTRWMPLECSLVGVAFDPTVGVGRNFNDSSEMEIEETKEEEAIENPVEEATETPAEEAVEIQGQAAIEEATEAVVCEAVEEAIEAVVDPQEEATETPADEAKEETEEVRTEENSTRSLDLNVIAETEIKPVNDILNTELLALRNVALKLKIKSEIEIDEILSRTTDITEARTLLLNSPQITYKENKPMNPNDLLYRSLSQALSGKFEAVDESLAGMISRTGERSFSADLFMTRANEMTTAAKGTNTIYDQNIGFLEILRARTAVLTAGAKTRVGNGALSYVRQKQAIAATLRAENSGTTTNTYADFEKVSYLPKALTAKVYLTDELQKESLIDLQNVLKQDMVKQFAIAIDNYAINGNASPAITGLLSAATITAGLYNKDLGVAALPTWATVNALKAAVDTKAVDLESCKFLVTPALLGVLEATAKLTNGSAIADNNKINGYGVLSTSNMPIATLNHSMIFGDFSNLEICLQGPTEFMVDTQSRFDEGITILTARQYFDVGVLQPSAFAKCANFLVA